MTGTWVTVIGFILLVAANFYTSRRKDRRDEIMTENNAMQLLKSSVDAYKGEVDKLREETRQQSKEISKLEGIISEKDKQLQMLERIFQNRNPEMEVFMKNTGLALNQLVADNKIILTSLEKILKDSSTSEISNCGKK